MDAKVDNGGGCPVMHGSLTETGKTVTDPDILHQHDTKAGRKEARLRCAEEGPDRADDRQPGLVAG
jgi:hypothetical protein